MVGYPDAFQEAVRQLQSGDGQLDMHVAYIIIACCDLSANHRQILARTGWRDRRPLSSRRHLVCVVEALNNARGASHGSVLLVLSHRLPYRTRFVRMRSHQEKTARARARRHFDLTLLSAYLRVEPLEPRTGVGKLRFASQHFVSLPTHTPQACCRQFISSEPLSQRLSLLDDALFSRRGQI